MQSWFQWYHCLNCTFLGKCGEKPEVRKLLNVIVLPSSEEFSLCLNASKKFACQTYHPTCLYSNSSGKIKVQISPPCRRPCEEYEPCKISLAFMRRLNDLVALCPGYHWNILLFAFPSCGEYLQHNQSVIERCQMLHPQGRVSLMLEVFARRHFLFARRHFYESRRSRNLKEVVRNLFRELIKFRYFPGCYFWACVFSGTRKKFVKFFDWK